MVYRPSDAKLIGVVVEKVTSGVLMGTLPGIAFCAPVGSFSQIEPVAVFPEAVPLRRKIVSQAKRHPERILEVEFMFILSVCETWPIGSAKLTRC